MKTDRSYSTDGDPVDSVVHVVDSPEDGAKPSDAATSNQTTSDVPVAAPADAPADTAVEHDVTPRPNSAKNSDMANISDAPASEQPVPEEPAAAPAGLDAGIADPATEPAATTVEQPAGYADEWRAPTDWRTDELPREVPADDLTPHSAHLVPPAAAPHPEERIDDEYEYADDYDDGALFAAIFSAPSLALAAFVFALTGLLGGMIPDSLPYLVQIDPTTGPAYHVRVVGLIALGFAIVAASLGLAAMLRSIGSPLRWPRYLGGAAVLLALLIALQSVLLIVLAGVAPTQGG